MKSPKFGMNSHDTSLIAGYANDVKQPEECGWDAVFFAGLSAA